VTTWTRQDFVTWTLRGRPCELPLHDLPDLPDEVLNHHGVVWGYDSEVHATIRRITSSDFIGWEAVVHVLPSRELVWRHRHTALAHVRTALRRRLEARSTVVADRAWLVWWHLVGKPSVLPLERLVTIPESMFDKAWASTWGTAYWTTPKALLTHTTSDGSFPWIGQIVLSTNGSWSDRFTRLAAARQWLRDWTEGRDDF